MKLITHVKGVPSRYFKKNEQITNVFENDILFWFKVKIMKGKSSLTLIALQFPSL